MRKLIVAAAIVAGLFIGSNSSQAQVAAVLLKCTKSWGVAISCVVIDAGVTKVVEISFDYIIAKAQVCSDKVDASKLAPSKISVSEVEAEGIAWGKLCEFLGSIIKSTPKMSAAEVREKAAANCAVRFQPICRQLGFPEPREEIMFGCNENRTRDACEKGTGCVWTGSVCRPGGTKQLLRQ